MTMRLVLIGIISLGAGGLATAEDAPVSGTFKGSGKEAKLAYAVALKGEPFADKPTIELVLCEKDPAKDAKPAFNARFGKLGSALVLTLHEEGKIVGCEVVHEGHERSGFSSIGKLNCSDFKLADGTLRGKLSTGGEVKTFGQTWEVDLKFQAKAPK